MRTLLLLACCAPALLPAATLQEYAHNHVLTIYTVKERATAPLGPGDQTNNLAVGDKILTLSGKGLTSLDGIANLRVVDQGRETPLASLERLHLFLNDNAISRLPSEFFTLQKLTFLYIMDNPLGAIPPEIAGMHGLLGMYFTGDGISRIPPEVFTMTWLRKLQVSKNHLTELPEAIGNLTNLIHLNLSANAIAVLPESIAKLTKLRVCDLSDNRFTRLPEGFGEVRILYQLRVRNDPITTLPAGFAKMPGTIDITGTKIEMDRLSPALRARISTEKPPKILKP